MSEAAEDFQDSTLDELLNDDAPESSDSVVSDPAPVETPQSEPEQEPGTDDKGEESTDEKDESPSDSSDNLSKREQGLYASQKAEREKRQALERELEELKSKQSEGSAEPEQSIDPLEDPKGFADSVTSKIDQVRLATRIETTQELMREKHDDYDDREAQFLELAKGNPALIQQMQAATSPAKFAYETAVKHERFSKFDSFEDAVNAEVEKRTGSTEKDLRAKIEKEFEAKLKTATSLPPSGAGGSLGGDNTTVGHDSLQDILGEE